MKPIYFFACFIVVLLFSHVCFAQCPAGTALKATISSVNSPGCQYDALQPKIVFKASGGTVPYIFSYIANGGNSQSIKTLGRDTSAAIQVSTGQTGTFTYKLTSVSDKNGCILAPENDSAAVVVNPAPFFNSAKAGQTCSGSPYSYTATSSTLNTNFSWIRQANPLINLGKSGSGTTAVINETLTSSANASVTATYIFTSSVNGNCPRKDTLKVAVNPTPKINSVPDTIFCNGEKVPGIRFSSPSPDSSFSWISDQAIGFGTVGKDSISAFIASNNSTAPLTAMVIVSVTANGCPGIISDTFKITVSPTPNLISRKDTGICNNTKFTYIAISSGSVSGIEWERLPLPASGITDKKGNSQNNGKPINTLSIKDSLTNTGTNAIVVKYAITLKPSASSASCSKTDTLKVTVYPTPQITISPAPPYTYCNGTVVNGIQFRSSSPDSLFEWNLTQNIGFGTNNINSIPSFTATNTDTNVVTTKAKVRTSVHNKQCYRKDTSFIIAINPTPKLVSSRDTSTCSGSFFIDTTRSSLANTIFSWRRDSTVHILGSGISDTTNIISEQLYNLTKTPVPVYYFFNLTAPKSACQYMDTLKVTVNPSPSVLSVKPHAQSVCNGDTIQQIVFTSNAKSPVYTWYLSPNIGFGLYGMGNIPNDTVSTTGTNPITVHGYVYVTDTATKCGDPSDTGSFIITVNPSPQKPNFTSSSSGSNSSNVSPLPLCSLSDNVNFNVTSPLTNANTSYRWTSSETDPAVVFIKDMAHPNTVIRFVNKRDTAILATITATVTVNNSKTQCSSSASQVVTIDTAKTNTSHLTIFKKQPGNLLALSDNSWGSYQWGYDKVQYGTSKTDTISGKPISILNQVYQFFVPDSMFIKDDTLDTHDFSYWVLVQNKNDDCYRKIYYNGPFDDVPVIIKHSSSDASIRLMVMPNPNNGKFSITLQGDIYGTIEAEIYSSSGQLVYRKMFVKSSSAATETFTAGRLPSGIYYLQL